MDLNTDPIHDISTFEQYELFLLAWVLHLQPFSKITPPIKKEKHLWNTIYLKLSSTGIKISKLTIVQSSWGWLPCDRYLNFFLHFSSSFQSYENCLSSTLSTLWPHKYATFLFHIHIHDVMNTVCVAFCMFNMFFWGFFAFVFFFFSGSLKCWLCFFF